MKGKWFAFGCLTSVVILIIVLTSTVFTLGNISKMGKQPTRAKLMDNSTLHFKLNGQIAEYNEFKDNFLSNPFLPNIQASHDIIEKIKMAKNDPKISSILLEPRWISAGYATLNEIGLAIKDFQTSGKPVYAYLDMCGNKDYFLASYADEIYLNPSASAGILLTGVGGSTLFYKDFMDKLGIEMTVLHAGQYKGAGENYYRRGFSAPVRKNLSILYSDLYDTILSTIADNRDIERDKVDYIYDERDEVFINQNQALDYKLVDGLSFKEEFVNSIVNNDKQLFSSNKYTVKRIVDTKSPQIAILYLQGQISTQTKEYQQNVLSAQKAAKAIDTILADDQIKGVVVRVNSPGGSALESEIIHNKLTQLRAKVPIVISMSNVAASGGYYISTPSDYIMADPFTITGSIGVVAMFPNVSGLKEKVGLSSDGISHGKFVNFLDFYNKPDAKLLASFEKGINTTYMEFKNRVSKGRELDLNAVEKIAQGQVWSSKSALSNGLIDEIGTIEKALQKAAQLAALTEYITSFYPKKVNLFEELLMEKLQVAANSDLTSKLLNNLELQKQFKQIELIKNEPIQMLYPYIELDD